MAKRPEMAVPGDVPFPTNKSARSGGKLAPRHFHRNGKGRGRWIMLGNWSGFVIGLTLSTCV